MRTCTCTHAYYANVNNNDNYTYILHLPSVSSRLALLKSTFQSLGPPLTSCTEPTETNGNQKAAGNWRLTH